MSLAHERLKNDSDEIGILSFTFTICVNQQYLTYTRKN